MAFIYVSVDDHCFHGSSSINQVLIIITAWCFFTKCKVWDVSLSLILHSRKETYGKFAHLKIIQNWWSAIIILYTDKRRYCLKPGDPAVVIHLSLVQGVTNIELGDLCLSNHTRQWMALGWDCHNRLCRTWIKQCCLKIFLWGIVFLLGYSYYNRNWQ